MKPQIRVHAYIRPLLTAIIALTPVMVVGAQDTARVIPSGRGPMPQRPMNNRRPVVDRLQERIDVMLRERLPLNDDQFTKLRAMNAKLEGERHAIRMEDQEIRQALRREMEPGAGASPNESRINELLERFPMVERRRIALQEQEQKELSRFLTPSQRARFFALQDEIRRNLQDIQRRRGGPPGDRMGPPPVRGPNRGIKRPPPL